MFAVWVVVLISAAIITAFVAAILLYVFLRHRCETQDASEGASLVEEGTL